MYNVMRFIGERCTSHFFSRVKVIGGDDVPKQGPIIVCCSHFS
jgi:1-acyl-sn-glycerol-3-phosphate acyltransferase